MPTVNKVLMKLGEALDRLIELEALDVERMLRKSSKRANRRRKEIRNQLYV